MTDTYFDDSFIVGSGLGRYAIAIRAKSLLAASAERIGAFKMLIENPVMMMV
jgi:hypothetical protein